MGDKKENILDALKSQKLKTQNQYQNQNQNHAQNWNKKRQACTAAMEFLWVGITYSS